MIGRIAGVLDHKGGDHVLIDVRGVGYVVHVSDRTLAQMPAPGEAVALYTELIVREDLLQLIGFATLIEKEWHRLLMTVQGVGVKAALAIIGTLGPEGVARAITLGDVTAIKAAPGVGPKIAQRVVLELKAKAPGVMAMGGTLATAPATLPAGEAPALAPKRRGKAAPAPIEPAMDRARHTADALSALVNLGYAQGEAAQAVAQAAAEAPEAAPAALIRAALKLLAPKG